jgi:hypothetical protein
MLTATLIENSELRGLNDDGPFEVTVVYLAVVNEGGWRWIGPEVGASLSHEDCLACLVNLEYALAMGLDTSDWAPFFPVYGSDAYVENNQESVDRWVEDENDREALLGKDGLHRPYVVA